ncbi:MAG TPA: phosphoribosylanthranilate isomerase [Acidimicrobiia bacterium]|nr:phosphoribosylanthranilate isomerase [Acidimicrobiia bacterium]
MTARATVWVKVCGITRAEDLLAAEQAGADAIGLVLVAGSPRVISFDRAVDLARLAQVPAVLVTRDMPPEELVAAAIATGAEGVQPYGDHSEEAARAATEVGLLVLRPVGPTTDLASVPDDQVPLFDNRAAGLLGGTGEPFDHSLLPEISRRFVLAGGLNPDNVASAVQRVRPWGVDASSGLEGLPGIKDPDLVARFVREAKAT